MANQTYEWDAFISHASEDKAGFARPLAGALASLGARIWYDEFTMRLGDSLSQSIDRGLARSRFGVVVLSQAFMTKPWTQHELAGLVARQIDGATRILPVWHEVSRAEVSAFSPTLADRFAVRTSDGSALDIALQILNVIRPDIYDAHPRAQLEKRANGEALAEIEAELVQAREDLAEVQCPFCTARVSTIVSAPVDPEERDWDLVRHFECGYSDFAGQISRLCPSDPNFPKFEDYELVVHEPETTGSYWTCHAFAKTDAARKVSLREAFSNTREGALEEMRANYSAAARPWC